MIRIGVHLEALRPGEIGGAERHVRQLIDLAPRVDPTVTWVLALAPYNVDTFAERPGVEKRLLTPEAFRVLDAEDLRGWHLDAWFCPLLTLEPAAPGLPSAAVIPDLQHETFPENFSPELLAWRRASYARTVRDADLVITVSAWSKQDLEKRLDLTGCGADKIVAIPHGLDPIFQQAAGQLDGDRLEQLAARYHLPAKYLFFPAHGWPHKNHRLLFAALAQLAARDGQCPHLVLTGGGADPAWPALWQSLGIDDRVRHLGWVPDGDLPGLYAGATMMVFPSRFEGFGLPVLEAMACGCPVLAADVTSLPEVGGDAVAYADPSSAPAFADAIDSLWNDPQRRRDLATRGRLRAARFDPETEARTTLRALRTLAGWRQRSPSRAPIVLEEQPPITVITPSYQQAAFLERTLESVLSQGYTALQYLVVDGGSDDGSVDLLEAYRARHPRLLDYVSEPDGGQAAAVNKGLERATGAIIGWLNSDDVYRPGTLRAVSRAWQQHPSHAWLYGRAAYINAEDQVLGPYPTRADFDWLALAHACFLCQPAVFWSPARLGQPYRLDPNLRMCMDYDLWIRLGQRHRPLFLDRELAASRVHPAAKTLSRRKVVFDETIGTVKRHYGYAPVSWVTGRAHFLWQPADDPLFPGPVRTGTWLLAALLVARYNPTRPGYVWRAIGELRRAARGARSKRRARA